MNLNAVHFHIVTNHTLTLGMVVALSAFFLALRQKDRTLTEVSLGTFVLVALVALPVFISGAAAQRATTDLVGVSPMVVRRHQDAALVAFAVAEILGLIAWLGLWQLRRTARLHRSLVGAMAFGGVITLALMTRAATYGGEIRHPEIVGAIEPGAAAADTDTSAMPAGSTSAAVASFVVTYAWVWQATETVHFVGMCLLMGILLAVNLRVIGWMKGVAFSALHRLLPVAALGFSLNTLSGMLFVVAVPEQYTQNPAFFLKVGFLCLAGLQAAYLTVSKATWALGPGDLAGTAPRLVATSGLVLWFGVVFWGSTLPFLGLRF
jgi:hypothetical protein